jgi:uncharacterized integral membrane protein
LFVFLYLFFMPLCCSSIYGFWLLPFGIFKLFSMTVERTWRKVLPFESTWAHPRFLVWFGMLIFLIFCVLLCFCVTNVVSVSWLSWLPVGFLYQMWQWKVWNM